MFVYLQPRGIPKRRRRCMYQYNGLDEHTREGSIALQLNELPLHFRVLIQSF